MSAPCPEYGFELRLRLRPEVPAATRDAAREAFLSAVQARGLVAAGGGDAVWRYVISRDGGQAIDADREALAAWAAGRPETADVVAGPLIDLSDAA